MPTLEEIEDVEDIDNMDMDIAQFDPTLRTPVAPAAPRSSGQTGVFGVGSTPAGAASLGGPTVVTPERTRRFNEEEMEQLKTFQVLYPAYFDKNRLHKQGRRVLAAQAVENPLAKTLADACMHLRIACVLEPEKTHPQDFGNSGRVRVLLKNKGVAEHPVIHNKRQLLNEVANYLKAHPTGLNTLYQVPPPQELEGVQPMRLPKVSGYRMNTIVPFHSPLTMKHPMAKSIYDRPPALEEGLPAPVVPKAPKKKVMRVRG